MSDRDDWYRPVDATTDAPEDSPPQSRRSPSAGADTRRPAAGARHLGSGVLERRRLARAARGRRRGHLEDGFHHPLDKVTGRLPRRVRLVVDWVVTIVGAIAIVLAIKAWVVNPYRIPSSSMEPTLHCARPATGCEARFSDRVLANRFIYHFRDPGRGEIVVFKTTPAVVRKCSAGGTFVKRIIGLPGETVRIRLINGREFVYINGRKLDEPYIQPSRRGVRAGEDVQGARRASTSSWGTTGRRRATRGSGAACRAENIIGKVFATYWPPQRISFR